jgi:hypothetical protein
MRSWEGLHHPVELQREQGDAVVAAFLGPSGGEILAPGKPEMIGP